MNRKERIKMTIDRKEVDYTPFHIDMTSFLRIKIADYYGIAIDQLEQKIGNHLLQFEYQPASSYKQPYADENFIIDEFGVKWDTRKKNIGDWGLADNPLKQPDISKVNWPNPCESGRFDHLQKLIKENPGRFNVLITPGIFDICFHMRGFSNFLADLAINPKFAHEMLENAKQFSLGLINSLPSQVDSVRFIEDMGTQKGLLISKKMWREFLKLRNKEIYGACKSKGIVIIRHSCGDVEELIPDFIDDGVDVLDPIQPEVMDIKNLKKKYGKYLTFFGGLGSQSTIPKGSPKDIRREVKLLHKILGKGGGYIIGPSGAIPTDAPIENVVALIEICQKICPTF